MLQVDVRMWKVLLIMKVTQHSHDLEVGFYAQDYGRPVPI